MPVNKLDTVFTDPQLDAINEAFNIINSNFTFAQNLTEAEKKANPTIDNTRYPYVQRTVEEHIVNMPQLVSGFSGTALNAANDFTVYNQLESIRQKALLLLNRIEETQDVAGAELFAFMRGVYEMAKTADDNQVAGARAVVDDIGSLFEGQGPQPTPPTP
ncbi:MAG TPA: hypothetical protein PKN75_06465 [Bacteroidia bacterium]|nr:hypothetical protein [Bacteroidia bacterium]HNU33218.1 hypothetical protein [Bacteroidia bacterium]